MHTKNLVSLKRYRTSCSEPQYTSKGKKKNDTILNKIFQGKTYKLLPYFIKLRNCRWLSETNFNAVTHTQTSQHDQGELLKQKSLLSMNKKTTLAENDDFINILNALTGILYLSHGTYKSNIELNKSYTSDTHFYKAVKLSKHETNPHLHVCPVTKQLFHFKDKIVSKDNRLKQINQNSSKILNCNISYNNSLRSRDLLIKQWNELALRFYFILSDLVLSCILKLIMPTKKDRQLKNLTFNALLYCLSNFRDESTKIYITGSSAYDVDTIGSDLDLVVITQDQNHLKVLKEIGDIIQKIKDDSIYFLPEINQLFRCNSIQLIENARVPILLLKSLDGVDCDISVNTMNSVNHTIFFHSLLKKKKCLRALMRIVKYWVRARKLPAMREGGLPSIAWMLLCVFVYRQCEVCYSESILRLNQEISSIRYPDLKAIILDRTSKFRFMSAEKFASSFTHWIWSLKPNYCDINSFFSHGMLLGEFFSNFRSRSELSVTISIAAGLSIPKNIDDLACRILSPASHFGTWDELLSIEDPSNFDHDFFPNSLYIDPETLLNRSLDAPDVHSNGIPTSFFSDLATKVSSATWLVYQYELKRAASIMDFMKVQYTVFQQKFISQLHSTFYNFLNIFLNILCFILMYLFTDNKKERYQIPAILSKDDIVNEKVYSEDDSLPVTGLDMSKKCNIHGFDSDSESLLLVPRNDPVIPLLSDNRILYNEFSSKLKFGLSGSHSVPMGENNYLQNSAEIKKYNNYKNSNLDSHQCVRNMGDIFSITLDDENKRLFDDFNILETALKTNEENFLCVPNSLCKLPAVNISEPSQKWITYSLNELTYDVPLSYSDSNYSQSATKYPQVILPLYLLNPNDTKYSMNLFPQISIRFNEKKFMTYSGYNMTCDNIQKNAIDPSTLVSKPMDSNMLQSNYYETNNNYNAQYSAEQNHNYSTSFPFFTTCYSGNHSTEKSLPSILSCRATNFYHGKEINSNNKFVNIACAKSNPQNELFKYNCSQVGIDQSLTHIPDDLKLRCNDKIESSTATMRNILLNPNGMDSFKPDLKKQFISVPSDILKKKIRDQLNKSTSYSPASHLEYIRKRSNSCNLPEKRLYSKDETYNRNPSSKSHHFPLFTNDSYKKKESKDDIPKPCKFVLVLLGGRLILLKLTKICVDKDGWWSNEFLSRRDIRSVLHGVPYFSIALSSDDWPKYWHKSLYTTDDDTNNHNVDDSSNIFPDKCIDQFLESIYGNREHLESQWNDYLNALISDALKSNSAFPENVDQSEKFDNQEKLKDFFNFDEVKVQNHLQKILKNTSPYTRWFLCNSSKYNELIENMSVIGSSEGLGDTNSKLKYFNIKTNLEHSESIKTNNFTDKSDKKRNEDYREYHFENILSSLCSYQQCLLNSDERCNEILFNPCNMVCSFEASMIQCNPSIYEMYPSEFNCLYDYTQIVKDAPYWYANIAKKIQSVNNSNMTSSVSYCSLTETQTSVLICKHCKRTGMKTLNGNIGLPHFPIHLESFFKLFMLKRIKLNNSSSIVFYKDFLVNLLGTELANHLHMFNIDYSFFYQHSSILKNTQESAQSKFNKHYISLKKLFDQKEFVDQENQNECSLIAILHKLAVKLNSIVNPAQGLMKSHDSSQCFGNNKANTMVCNPYSITDKFIPAKKSTKLLKPSYRKKIASFPPLKVSYANELYSSENESIVDNTINLKLIETYSTDNLIIQHHPTYYRYIKTYPIIEKNQPMNYHPLNSVYPENSSEYYAHASFSKSNNFEDRKLDNDLSQASSSRVPLNPLPISHNHSRYKYKNRSYSDNNTNSSGPGSISLTNTDRSTYLKNSLHIENDPNKLNLQNENKNKIKLVENLTHVLSDKLICQPLTNKMLNPNLSVSGEVSKNLPLLEYNINAPVKNFKYSNCNPIHWECQFDRSNRSFVNCNKNIPHISNTVEYQYFNDMRNMHTEYYSQCNQICNEVFEKNQFTSRHVLPYSSKLNLNSLINSTISPKRYVYNDHHKMYHNTIPPTLAIPYDFSNQIERNFSHSSHSIQLHLGQYLDPCSNDHLFHSIPSSNTYNHSEIKINSNHHKFIHSDRFQLNSFKNICLNNDTVVDQDFSRYVIIQNKQPNAIKHVSQSYAPIKPSSENYEFLENIYLSYLHNIPREKSNINKVPHQHCAKLNSKSLTSYNLKEEEAETYHLSDESGSKLMSVCCSGCLPYYCPPTYFKSETSIEAHLHNDFHSGYHTNIPLNNNIILNDSDDPKHIMSIFPNEHIEPERYVNYYIDESRNAISTFESIYSESKSNKTTNQIKNYNTDSKFRKVTSLDTISPEHFTLREDKENNILNLYNRFISMSSIEKSSYSSLKKKKKYYNTPKVFPTNTVHHKDDSYVQKPEYNTENASLL